MNSDTQAVLGISGFIFGIIVFIALLAWSMSPNSPVSTHQSSNPNVAVSLLFEHEGVKVYRFRDGGREHYYAVKNSGETRTETLQREGKNNYRVEGIGLIP